MIIVESIGGPELLPRDCMRKAGAGAVRCCLLP